MTVAVLSGASAALVGFGIGSIMTPILAISLGVKAAVIIVAIPHFVATTYRCWSLRESIDRDVLIRFGSMSAAGGLIGAALYSYVPNAALSLIFASLLILAGCAGLSGANKRIKLRGTASWVAGGLSGMFGGLVGNQGGIRSAALLGFDLSKESFVATATAVGVIVDCVRIPIYLLWGWSDIEKNLPLISIITLGTITGTIIGVRCLRSVPEQIFAKIVSLAILILGLAFAYKSCF